MKRKEEVLSPAAMGALLAGQLDNFVAASTPGGIEAMEKAGQDRLTANPDRLPIDGTQDRGPWESVGFVFGEPIKETNGTIFVACTYPKGWKLVPTGHSMWSDLVDDSGKKRASVFFKAAFYDYNAHTFGLDK